MTNHTYLLRWAYDVMVVVSDSADFTACHNVEDDLYDVMKALRTAIEGDDDE